MTEDDDDKLNRDMMRGQLADALLKNELLNEIFDSREQAFIEAWKSSPLRDSEARERLWQAVQIIGMLRSDLLSAVADANLATEHITKKVGGLKRDNIFQFKH